MPLDTQNVVQDGSLETAVAMMPDIVDQQGQAPAEQPREVNGRWTNDPGARQVRDADVETQPQKDAKAQPDPNAQDSDEEASDAAEEWFELPPAKPGEKPQRLKATEVWEKAQRVDQLQAELEDARRVQTMPEEYDQTLMQAVQRANDYSRGLQVLAQRLRPQEPDFELLNEESPRHNPGLYYRQMAMAKQQAGELAAINQEMQRVQREAAANSEAIARAQFARSQAQLHSFWPEVRDPKVAQQVRSDLVSHYGRFGVTEDLINSVSNAAFYALAKDALAYRNGLRAQEQAVKVVRAKPKLVRSAARDQAPKAKAMGHAMSRLQQSGSLEDAADVIGNLL